MIERLLALKPADVDPVWIVVVSIVGVGLCVWLQRRFVRTSDRWLDRWARRK